MSKISKVPFKIDFEAAEILDPSSLKKIQIKQSRQEFHHSWVSYSGENRFESISLLRLCQDYSKNILLCPPIFRKYESLLLRQLSSYFPTPNSLIAFCSSGSSGVPKLVIHTFPTLIESARNLILHYPNTANSMTYSAFPFFYMAGILNNLIVPLLGQSTVVIDKEFDFSSAFSIGNVFRRFPIEWAWLSPGMINSIVNANRKFNLSSEINFILSATGPLRKQKRDIAMKLFECEVYNTYGLTELLFVSGEKQTTEEITLGNPLRNCGLRLMDEEIQIFTHTSCVNVFHLEKNSLNPAKLEKTVDNWIKTNDRGGLSSDGIFLSGRNDDIAVLHGVNVSLNVIEEIAESFDSIQAACARLSTSGSDDFIELFVESENHAVDFQMSLRRHLATHLPANWLPSNIKLMTLPRLASGKVDRLSLRNSEWI
jgi:acyl-coenzyme A synthetase/AMP-(fatty) acid ligase